ncbi:MAG TPA: superoxide dismutase family protein [Methylomirabilota bacterium]|jgi:Cu-Zn family superoxide dismutase|nr:superoxide dismutase family protein [Methylomirabilota bacterium]
MKRALVLISGLALTGCAAMGGQTAGRTPAAAADLKNAQGQSIGTATLTEQDGKVRIVVQAKGLTPGTHGIHIHAVGRCDPPGFTSAGAHYNPLGRKHGLEAPDGPHAGDLSNLEADQAGNARYEATTDRVTLSDGLLSVFDGDGSAVVIHEKADDQKTDPTGDSGGRVACGVITKRG